MKFFDKPIIQTIAIPLHAVDGAGTTAMRFTGPPGARGRIRQLSTVIVNDTTVATCLVRLGITGTLAAYASLVVPIGVAGVVTQLGKAAMDNVLLPADLEILLNDDGAATDGDVAITVIIDWERKGPR